MLPVVDKPLIQYAVEEAISAGITDLIFVTSSTKRAIEDHFDSNFELEYKLEQAGKKPCWIRSRISFQKGSIVFMFARPKLWVLVMPYCVPNRS
ncbi:hypothetical protein [Aeromonas veronii]|uniref:hypothetical protein n=1 Tax=Aeromonas veronii TaxID=654 RepID=UPI003672070F